MSRQITRRYDDPLALIWLGCATELGIVIRRSHEVYASFDGEHTLTLSADEGFDPDDSLAQLIFHELCHGLVAGPRKRREVDWGMENIDDRDLLVEHACHRLQARLADDYGLRGLFGVTTDHRAYWDALPIDPLGPSRDPAVPLAREAYADAYDGPWASALKRALTRTQQLAAVAREAAQLAGATALPSLWADVRTLHESGFPEGDHGESCGDCAWYGGDGERAACIQAKARARDGRLRVSRNALGCTRFEARLEEAACGPCGACCREAFDRVEIGARDVVRKRHPELVVVDSFGAHLPRPGGRCVALQGDGAESLYRCRVYADRPRSCAHFTRGGDACLLARRRVGLSP
jgi:hypothetical protein